MSITSPPALPVPSTSPSPSQSASPSSSSAPNPPAGNNLSAITLPGTGGVSGGCSSKPGCGSGGCGSKAGGFLNKFVSFIQRLFGGLFGRR